MGESHQTIFTNMFADIESNWQYDFLGKLSPFLNIVPNYLFSYTFLQTLNGQCHFLGKITSWEMIRNHPKLSIFTNVFENVEFSMVNITFVGFDKRLSESSQTLNFLVNCLHQTTRICSSCSSCQKKWEKNYINKMNAQFPKNAPFLKKKGPI